MSCPHRFTEMVTAAHADGMCPLCMAARIERLRAALDAFSKAVSMPGGPSLAVQRHNPSWTAWKQLCDALAGKEGT